MLLCRHSISRLSSSLRLGITIRWRMMSMRSWVVSFRRNVRIRSSRLIGWRRNLPLSTDRILRKSMSWRTLWIKYRRLKVRRKYLIWRQAKVYKRVKRLCSPRCHINRLKRIRVHNQHSVCFKERLHRFWKKKSAILCRKWGLIRRWRRHLSCSLNLHNRRWRFWVRWRQRLVILMWTYPSSLTNKK